MGRALLVGLLLVWGAGCLVVMDDETPGRGAPGEVVGDCVVPVPAGVEALGPPVSLELAEGSLWVFGETQLTAPGAAGATVIPNAAALVRSVDDGCAGRLELLRDADGVPAPFAALLPEEEADNAARTDGKRVDVTPRGGFAWQGRGYLYYDKLLRGPGMFDAEWLGTGLCVTAGAGAPCVRQDRLLWEGADAPWGGAGLLGDDGLVYLVACFHAAAFVDLCGVARVAPASAADPGAYRFYNVFNNWVEDPRNYTVAFDGPGSVTPGRSAFLDRYTVVYANIWESTVELRVAPEPWGSWGDARVLFDAVAPDSWFIGGGVEHAALRSADGATLAITYHVVSATGPSGLHLVSYRLRGD